MTPEEYEQLVAALVDKIRMCSTALVDVVIGSGINNKLLGASGYKHQIDVSIVGERKLFLFECKRWCDNVGAEAVMVHATRKMDIEAANKDSVVVARIVTKKGFTAGALKIADQFDIGRDVVQSAEEFAIRVEKHIRAGTCDRIGFIDEFASESIESPSGETGLEVVVRRQWNDWREAVYRVSDLDCPHWANQSGGVRQLASRYFIHAYVLCDAMKSGELAHSCQHTPPPHRIKVCVVKKANDPQVFALLEARAGKNPNKVGG